MHELGIAEETLTAIQRETTRYPKGRVVRAGLRIGELAGVNISALQFAFDAITPGTNCEGMKVEMELVPRQHCCADCGKEFVVREYDFTCPACHCPHTQCIAGEELDLVFVEVEEHAAN
jgi:hydrogenase nickel incorporation protein HypA/HybF